MLGLPAEISTLAYDLELSMKEYRSTILYGLWSTVTKGIQLTDSSASHFLILFTTTAFQSVNRS